MIDSVFAVQYYRNMKWQIDRTVFFNSSMNSCILLFLAQDTSITANTDDIWMILGLKKDNVWHYYMAGMPVIYAWRKDKEHPEVPYTFHWLSDEAKSLILKGGYYKPNSCTINDDYVNGWYNDRREDLHEKFLERREQ